MPGCSGAANLFFLKSYNEDFKKNNTKIFFGGDPIYGLVNVTPISINDNTITTVEEFADQNGNVMIRIYFPSLNKEIVWKMTLSSGRVKNNRFLFCLMPEKPEKLDKDYFEILKILNQESGKKVMMNVRVGQKDVTAWWQDDLTIDLTKGMGQYATWYNDYAPAEIKNTYTFYNVCQTKSQTYLDFQKAEVTVLALTADSLRFISSGTSYFAKKIEGLSFLKGSDLTIGSFYANKVDENSFVLYQPGPKAYNYYHTDKNKSNEQDVNKRCPITVIEKMDLELKRYEELENIERRTQTKIKLTEYARTTKSKRNDPVLEKKIFEWWNVHNPGFPAIKVFFIETDFFLTRDNYNQVLRKTIGAMVVYKGTQGTCWMQWNSFGYEHLGGGAFTDELTAWKAGFQQYGNYVFRISDIEIYAGTNYEVDCAGLK